jgi:NAD(P) transhydrogenase subunit alpha
MDSFDATIERARAAAAAARDAALAAHGAAGDADAMADRLSAAAHAATGGAVDPFVFRLAIFALAVFVGYYVVWSVTPALHTPLMSVTNAISSVIVVGALLSVGVAGVNSGAVFAKFVGFAALILASVNIFGGFMVTERMLAMYKKKG